MMPTSPLTSVISDEKRYTYISEYSPTISLTNCNKPWVLPYLQNDEIYLEWVLNTLSIEHLVSLSLYIAA